MVRITIILDSEDFLGSVESTSSEAVAPPHHASLYNALADFPTRTGYTLKQSHPFDCMFILLRPSASDNE